MVVVVETVSLMCWQHCLLLMDMASRVRVSGCVGEDKGERARLAQGQVGVRVNGCMGEDEDMRVSGCKNEWVQGQKGGQGQCQN